MPWLLVIGWTILTVSFGAATAAAEKRVALAIGNAAYRNAAVLPNPANDATDVAASLRRLGFEVTQVADLNLEDMRRALITFGRQRSGADIAIIFFAGHGMEIAGENRLIPIDAELRTDTDASEKFHRGAQKRGVLARWGASPATLHRCEGP